MKIKIMAALLVAAGAMLSVNGMKKGDEKIKILISNHTEDDIVAFVTQHEPKRETVYNKIDIAPFSDSDVVRTTARTNYMYVATKKGARFLIITDEYVSLHEMNGKKVIEMPLHNVVLLVDNDGAIKLLPHNK